MDRKDRAEAVPAKVLAWNGILIKTTDYYPTKSTALLSPDLAVNFSRY